MPDSGIIIVGSGPSLCEADIRAVAGLPSFCFNRSFLMFRKWHFEPRYYGCFDELTAEDIAPEIERIVFAETSAEIFLNSKARQLYKHGDSSRMHFLSLNSDVAFKISLDCISDLGSAAANATQIAAKLGYRKMVLLGVDALYNLSHSQPQDQNHFDPAYSSGLRQRKYSDLSEMLQGWERAALGCAEANIEVINASRETALNCFPRKSLIECLAWLKV